MFVAASTACFGTQSLPAICRQLTELEFDKLELWFSESRSSLRPSAAAADPEGFLAQFHECTRLTPVAMCLAEDVPPATFAGLSKLAKLLRITQITVPSSPLGTPFNTEIDRLKGFLEAANRNGVRLSLKTKTGQLTADPHTAVELCQAVKGLGLTLDPSYYLCNGNGSVPFEQVYPYVYHVHLRDSTPRDVQVQVGLGDIDYGRLINHLRRQRYQRILSVALIPELTDPAQLPLELRKLRMLLETLL